MLRERDDRRRIVARSALCDADADGFGRICIALLQNSSDVAATLGDRRVASALMAARIRESRKRGTATADSHVEASLIAFVRGPFSILGAGCCACVLNASAASESKAFQYTSKRVSRLNASRICVA